MHDPMLAERFHVTPDRRIAGPILDDPALGACHQFMAATRADESHDLSGLSGIS
jgi:hypothetical protein